MGNKIVSSINLTLKSRKHLLLVILSFLFMVLVSLFIPVLTIPSNFIELQLSFLTLDSALLIILFSILFGLSVGMHSYATALNKSHKNLMIANSTGTSFVGAISSIFAGKLCPVCISTIFSIIGLGGSTVLFALSYRTEILITSLLIMLVSIYLASERIGACAKTAKNN